MKPNRPVMKLKAFLPQNVITVSVSDCDAEGVNKTPAVLILLV